MFKQKGVHIGLLLLNLLVIGVYLGINTYGNWQYAWALRSKRVVAFMLVSLATSSATISFQTITQNQLITPSILGLDSLYILIQTILFFLLGGTVILQQTGMGFFLSNIVMMVGLSQLLFFFLLKQGQANIFLLLIIGMILSTLFASISTFLQVVMDPNEYELLQGKLFASFNNIPSHYLLPAMVLIGCTWLLLFYKSRLLDVFHLGHYQAINLGIETDRFQFFVSLLFLTGGQLLVEQIFGWNTTISIIVEFLGGLYFMTKLIRERKTIG